MPRKVLIPLAVLFSGICWYLSFDLSLHWWWPIWLAPAPVLYVAPRLNGRQTFLMAFLAFLIGRLSWLFYLLSVVIAPLAILYTVFFPLIFALIMLPVRKILLKASPMIACLAFPVLWTVFEFLQLLFSPDGTIGSIAYTQSDFLPVIQLASITGIMGITFLLCLIPSAAAVAALHRSSGKKIRTVLFLSGCLVIAAITYGRWRMREKGGQPGLIVGLAAIDTRSYGYEYNPPMTEGPRFARIYLQEVERLAKEGARIVVIPEKAIPVTDSTDTIINDIFIQAARRMNISIVGSYLLLKDKRLENRAWAFSPEGDRLVNYSKVNLFEGERAQGFVAGKEAGIFRLNGVVSGMAICKDLDFAPFMRTYSRQGAVILYAPAWDFVQDGWLHSRIAMLRAIENGYSLVRDARQGRLTLSDDRGRVTAEASSEQGRNTVIGKIRPSDGRTLYSYWGDWFGYLDLLTACFYLILTLALRKRPVRLVIRPNQSIRPATH
jgi:apolipoprotein N-acyltransferase